MTLHCRHHRLCCALLTSYPSTEASVPSAALGNMKQLPSFQPSSAEKCRDDFCTTKRTPKAIFSANLLRHVSRTDSYPKTQGSGQCGRDVVGFICNQFTLLQSIKTPLTVHKEAQQPPNCIHIRASVLFLCVSNYFLLDVQEPHQGHIWILDWGRCLSLRSSIWQTLTALNFTNGCKDLGQMIISYLNLWNWHWSGWKGGNGYGWMLWDWCKRIKTARNRHHPLWQSRSSLSFNQEI